MRRGRGAATIRDRGRFAMTLPLRLAARRHAAGGAPAAGAALLLLLVVVRRPAAGAGAGGRPVLGDGEGRRHAPTRAAKAREAARLDGQRRALAAIADRLPGGRRRGQTAEARRQGDHRPRRQFRGRQRADVGGALYRRLHFPFPPGRDPRGALRLPGPRVAETPAATFRQAAGGSLRQARHRVCPVYQAGGRSVLWEDPNPWRDAWAQRPRAGPLHLIVPLGDAGDIAAIDADKARAGDADALAAIARQQRRRRRRSSRSLRRAARQTSRAGST